MDNYIKQDDTYDLIFKTVIVGESGVGKSNLLSVYIDKNFNNETKATVGVEFGSKKLTIDGKSIKAQIWDTAGQERYRSITSAYYKGAKGSLIVFDLTNKESFESVERWFSEVKNECNSDLVTVLIGNKCDLIKERKVKKEEALDKAEKLEMAYIETSAKDNTNVDKCFELVCNAIYKKSKHLINSDIDDILEYNSPSVNINSKNNNEYNKKCC